MSSNANAIFGQLREIIKSKRINLTYLSSETKIPYHRLWRFLQNEKSLSMEDTETLYIKLTGKTFIAPTNVA